MESDYLNVEILQLCSILSNFAADKVVIPRELVQSRKSSLKIMFIVFLNSISFNIIAIQININR